MNPNPAAFIPHVRQPAPARWRALATTAVLLGLGALAASAATINVTNNSTLTSALSSVNPGDEIVLGNGNYTGFTVARSGTAAAPIVIRAANQGSATINAGVVLLNHVSYVTLQGLTVTTPGGSRTVDGEAFNVAVWFEATNHCRLTRSTLHLSGHAAATHFVLLGGHGDANRIDHNEFGPNTVDGVHYVWPRGQRDIPGVTPPSDRTSWANGNGPVNPNIPLHTQIDHNYMHDQAAGTAEAMVLGGLGTTGDYQNYGTVVEFNLLVNCDGDPEFISVKSSGNFIRYNTIRTSIGMISLRSGNNSMVYNNVLLQAGKSGSGGIKFFEKDHAIFNNYIDNADQYPILIGTGDSYTGSFTHAQVFRAKVLNNTVVNINSTPVSFGFGAHVLGAVDTVFANNIVVGTAKPIFQELVKPTNVTYSSNIAWPTSGGTLGTTTPFTVVDPQLTTVSGLRKLATGSPAINAANETLAPLVIEDMDGQTRSDLDIGADEFSSAPIELVPLTTADVGPNSPPDIPATAAPGFNPVGGTYPSAQSVTITTSTIGATIRYTTNGSTPTSTVGTVYTGPVPIASTTTLKAIAYKSGNTDSAVTSATYTITATPPPTVTMETDVIAHTSSGATITTGSDASASGGVILYLNATAAGQYAEFTTTSLVAGTYQLKLRFKANNSRGQHNVTIDGTQVDGTIDEYASASGYVTATVGNVSFATAGTHTVRLTVTGKNASSSNFILAPDSFTFVGQ